MWQKIKNRVGTRASSSARCMGNKLSAAGLGATSGEEKRKRERSALTKKDVKKDHAAKKKEREKNLKVLNAARTKAEKASAATKTRQDSLPGGAWPAAKT